MSTLLERMLLVVSTKRVKNARRWAMDAKLHPSHVNTVLSRLRAGTQTSMGYPELAALAKAANVSVAWLADGTEPMDPEAAPPTVIAPADDYPSRAPVLAMARAKGVAPAAVAALAAERLHSEDPGEDYWFKRLEWYRKASKLMDQAGEGEADFDLPKRRR